MLRLTICNEENEILENIEIFPRVGQGYPKLTEIELARLVVDFLSISNKFDVINE